MLRDSDVSSDIRAACGEAAGLAMHGLASAISDEASFAAARPELMQK